MDRVAVILTWFLRCLNYSISTFFSYSFDPNFIAPSRTPQDFPAWVRAQPFKISKEKGVNYQYDSAQLSSTVAPSPPIAPSTLQPTWWALYSPVRYSSLRHEFAPEVTLPPKYLHTKMLNWTLISKGIILLGIVSGGTGAIKNSLSCDLPKCLRRERCE